MMNRDPLHSLVVMHPQNLTQLLKILWNTSILREVTRIKHANEDSLKSTEYIAPINNSLHSMFSQVDVTIQNKLITSTTTHYPYKAMIQNMLSYGTDAKKSQLTSQLYFKDKTGHYDDNDVKNGANTSLYTRSFYFSQSQT